MANNDDARRQDTAVADQAGSVPKGVILDKDGKPCRSCNSFSSWKLANEQIKNRTKTSSTSAATTTTPTPTAGPPAECPPDVESLGRSAWTVLHTMAASYPEAATRSQQADMASFVGLFARLYPCWVCAEDFQRYVGRERPRLAGRDSFGLWLCGAHNDVNRKLGKPEFDCARWLERWRDGPPDGRCD